MNGPQKAQRLEGLSVVLPCYNEAANLESVIQDALSVLPSITHQFELLIIDDGSVDGTSAIAARFIRVGLPLRLITHDRNQGYGAALNSGFQAAINPWLFFTDADGQFSFDDLQRLAAESGRASVVIGYRQNRADPWLRCLSGWTFSAFSRLLFGIRARDVNCAFKLFRRDFIGPSPFIAKGALINVELLTRLSCRGAEMVQVPVNHRARHTGKATGGSFPVVICALLGFLPLWWKLIGRPLVRREAVACL